MKRILLATLTGVVSLAICWILGADYDHRGIDQLLPIYLTGAAVVLTYITSGFKP